MNDEFLYRDELNTVESLIKEFGTEVTLNQIKTDLINKPLGYKCPKCNGVGKYRVSKNIYPSGLPDSGWVFKQGWEDHICDICLGKGYTEDKIIEMYIVAGSSKTVTGYCTEDGTKTWNLPEIGDKPF